MMSSTHQTRKNLTLEQFLQLPEEEPPLEYVDGRIEAKVSPQHMHSKIQTKLATYLDSFAERTRSGSACVELRCTFAGRSIVPDVVFLLKEHIELDDDGRLVDEIRRPPDIHVEVISPDRKRKRSHDKLVHSTAHGCPLGWLIHPYNETIDVYRPGHSPERLAADGVLDGEPVLTGFRLPVAEVFGWLRPKF
jgi:Uma2 family endonuclease